MERISDKVIMKIQRQQITNIEREHDTELPWCLITPLTYSSLISTLPFSLEDGMGREGTERNGTQLYRQTG